MQYLPLDLKIVVVCVFLQAGLTFYAAVRMAIARARAVKAHEVRLADVALQTNSYPEHARQHANNLSNQFEFPILLYVAAVFAALFEASSMPFALACMGYVVTRFHHRFIHVTSNNVIYRFQSFLLGVVFLFMAWVFLALGFLDIL